MSRSFSKVESQAHDHHAESVSCQYDSRQFRGSVSYGLSFVKFPIEQTGKNERYGSGPSGTYEGEDHVQGRHEHGGGVRADYDSGGERRVTERRRRRNCGPVFSVPRSTGFGSFAGRFADSFRCFGFRIVVLIRVDEGRVPFGKLARYRKQDLVQTESARVALEGKREQNKEDER